MFLLLVTHLVLVTYFSLPNTVVIKSCLDISITWGLLKLQIPWPWPRPRHSHSDQRRQYRWLSLKNWLLHVLLPRPSLLKDILQKTAYETRHNLKDASCYITKDVCLSLALGISRTDEYQKPLSVFLFGNKSVLIFKPYK